MKDTLLMVDCQYANTRGSGGAGTYVRKVVDYLHENKAGLDFDQDILNAYEESSFSPSKAVKGVAKHISQAMLPGFAYNLLLSAYRQSKAFGNQVHLPQDCLKGFPYRTVILHEMTNYSVHHWAGRLLSHRNVKLVTTFLDLQDCFYPDFFDDHELLQRKRNYAFFRQHCEHFISISDHTKSTMVEILGIEPSRITTVHLASDICPPVKDLKMEAQISQLGSYFIYPAKLWAHKNHRFLFKTLGQIKSELKARNFKMVLTGGASHRELKKLNEQIQEYGLEEVVVPMGFLTENELKLLISGAEYLVFPSLFEGFGMPVVEAMQLGCPVISSNAGSLAEICQEAALMFDPTDQMQLEELLLRAIHGQIDRLHFVRKGYENAKRFSWDKCVLETLEVYRKLEGHSVKRPFETPLEA